MSKKKFIPEWAKADKSLRLHILAPAMRRYRIAELYWLRNWTAKAIAFELDTTVGAVEKVIKKLTPPK